MHSFVPNRVAITSLHHPQKVYSKLQFSNTKKIIALPPTAYSTCDVGKFQSSYESYQANKLRARNEKRRGND